MLIGVGPDAFDRQWQRITGSAPGAHNEVLQTLAAQGLLGVAFLACATGAYILAIRRTRDEVRFTLVLVGIVGLSFMAMETPLRPEQSITGVGFLFVSVFVALCSSSTTTEEGLALRSSREEKVHNLKI